MMPGRPPVMDEKLRAALEAIDQARLDIDKAVKNGDNVAAEDLLKKINRLAQEIDKLTSEDSGPGPGSGPRVD